MFNLDTHEQKTIVRGGGRSRFVRTGHLLFAQERRLLGVAFDVDRLDAVGEPAALFEARGTSDFDVAEDGTIVYISRPDEFEDDLVWVDRSGVEEPLGAPPREYNYPKLSPDGTRVAVEIRAEGGRDIWIWDIQIGRAHV